MTGLARILVAAASALVATLAPAAAGPAAAGGAAPLPRHYRAVPLTGISGDRVGAYAMNDRGQVVGHYEVAPDVLHPFLWQRGRMTDLGVLETGPEERGMARDINAGGDVVGSSERGGRQRAVLWRRGRIIELGHLGSGSSYATAINDRGQIIGTSYTVSGEPRGFIWERGRMRDLGVGGFTQPLDINNRGQVVGWSGRGVEGPQHAFLWRRGVVTWLPPGRGSRATAINDRGEIVGSIDDRIGEPVSHAVRWHRGRMTQLGALPGGNASSAVAINERGQVLGIGNVQPDLAWAHAFLYWRGTLRDLTPAGVPATVAYGATDVNNRGQLLIGLAIYTPVRRHDRGIVLRSTPMT
jgi:probable HAF family extracellular repeat protein